MGVRVTFTGVDEMQTELHQFPDAAAAEAASIVLSAGTTAAQVLRSVYQVHRVTGHLADTVTVTPRTAGALVAGAKVTANSPIAWLFDNGSQARHWASGKSTGAMWGKTPPTHIFVRTLMAARRTLAGPLRALLERHGLTVSGDVDG